MRNAIHSSPSWRPPTRADTPAQSYKGTFSDVAVSLIPLRVTITDLRLVQDGTAVEDAVLFVKEFKAQVAWNQLLRARLEATAIAKHAHFRCSSGRPRRRLK